MTAITQMFVPSPQQVFGKSNLLVLVEGLDYDYNDKDEEYSTNSRSDVIWAVNLDFANKRIYQLSIPRDMVATMPNGTQAKINQAQSDGGVKEAKSVIARWLGIPGFDRYVILRIDATKEFIDAIGGVDVDVKSSNCLHYKTDCTGDTLDYDDTWGHLHIHLKEGLQHLDGEQAVAYMRFRHDWCSDPCRIMRQQQVLARAGRQDQGRPRQHVACTWAISRPSSANTCRPISPTQELFSIATYFQGMPIRRDRERSSSVHRRRRLAELRRFARARHAARAQLVATMLVAPPAPVPSPDAMALAAIRAATLRVDIENGSGVSGRRAPRRDRAEAGRIHDRRRRRRRSLRLRHDRDSRALERHVCRSESAQRAAAGLREAVVVPDPSPSSSPAATATHDQRRDGHRRQRSCEKSSAECCRITRDRAGVGVSQGHHRVVGRRTDRSAAGARSCTAATVPPAFVTPQTNVHLEFSSDVVRAALSRDARASDRRSLAAAASHRADV